jgi:NAD(P)-dependent dehydrogenase (short-subunit alcohol dehydrogenase family)
MGRLDNKVAVITGANSGIGLASAERFAQEGAQVFMTGRRQGELDAAVAKVGRGAVGVQGDIANLADLDRLYNVVRSEAGRIDILFANAGGGEFAALSDITEEHFERTFATNVKGTLFTVQKALPLLVDGASVILTGSTAASTGTPAFSVYGASKAAIRSFARNWSLDLSARGIRVNVLVPGPTSTPGLHGLSSTEDAKRALRHRCRWVGWDRPTRSRQRRCSWPPTSRALSTAANSLPMAGRRKSERHPHHAEEAQQSIGLETTNPAGRHGRAWFWQEPDPARRETGCRLSTSLGRSTRVLPLPKRTLALAVSALDGQANNCLSRVCWAFSRSKS